MKVYKVNIIKDKTTSGNLSKLTVLLIFSENTVMAFEKLLLIDIDKVKDASNSMGFTLVKTYKNKALMKQVFLIKEDILNEILLPFKA